MRKSALWKNWPASMGAVLLLAGCGSAEDQVERVTTFDITEAEAQIDSQAPVAAGDVGSDIAITQPQIAYVYDYGFRISGADMPALQQRHADLCESLGQDRCRILNMSQSGGAGEYSYGRLELAVAADAARGFGQQLAQAAQSAGGAQIASAIMGEDLSKQIVDTEARLRARTVLRDRLMELLATRRGTVGELLEAERGVAQVNEEIDQARSWLEEMRGRVAFSRVNVGYESGSAGRGGFAEPVRNALTAVSAILGTVIGGIIMVLAGLLPIALLGAAALWLWRSLRQRQQRRESVQGEARTAAAEADIDQP